MTDMLELKIGDEVKLLDKEKSTYGKIGTVIAIDPILSGLYAVRCLEDGSVGLYYESELESCEGE